MAILLAFLTLYTTQAINLHQKSKSVTNQNKIWKNLIFMLREIIAPKQYKY